MLDPIFETPCGQHFSEIGIECFYVFIIIFLFSYSLVESAFLAHDLNYRHPWDSHNDACNYWMKGGKNWYMNASHVLKKKAFNHGGTGLLTVLVSASY